MTLPYLSLSLLLRKPCERALGVASLGSWVCPPRSIHTSAFLPGIKDLFIKSGDLNKRPSQLEIQQKGLPENTPTLAERLRRGSSTMFHNPDPKDGYYKGKTGTVRDYMEDIHLEDIYREGLQQIKHEVIKLKDEMLADPWAMAPNDNEYRPFWKFKPDEDFEDKWVTTSDSEWGEGYSKCDLTRSKTGRGYFSGELSTRVPKDGRIARAGYCNLRSVIIYRSFARPAILQFDFYTAFRIRLRGDGRPYFMNVHLNNRYDIYYNDLWSFPIHTRGGPYWEEVTIPFSKFFLSVKSHLLDDQERFNSANVNGVSFTLKDDVDGPFALEVDEIGLVNLPEVTENNFDYESYILPERSYNQKM